MRKFKIKKEVVKKYKDSTIWRVDRDGVIFILTTDDMSIGDYFVFTKPDDPYVILDHKEMLKYNEIRHAKVMWWYNKVEKDLNGILYKAKPTSELYIP